MFTAGQFARCPALNEPPNFFRFSVFLSFFLVSFLFLQFVFSFLVWSNKGLQKFVNKIPALKKRGKNCKSGGYAAFLCNSEFTFKVNSGWKLVIIRNGKPNLRIYRGSCTMVWCRNIVHFAFCWPSFKREFFSSNTSLKKHWFIMRGWFRFGINPLSAGSRHCESYFGRKHRNVWFRTLSSKAIHVFPAQFLLN